MNPNVFTRSQLDDYKKKNPFKHTSYLNKTNIKLNLYEM